MKYFDQIVIEELADEDVLLSTAEQAAYIEICEGIKKGKKPIKSTKKPEQCRRFSLWHIPQADKNAPWAHWLVLPGKPNWETKHAYVVAKLAVNIVTGEKNFLKIRRPLGEFHEIAHVKSSIMEATNHLHLGGKGFHTERNTLHGYKAYLFQNYGGKANLIDLVDNFKTTPREIVGFTIAAGEALAAVHRAGFIHCDFKFENVVYNKRDQTVSLIDLEYMISIAEGEAGIKVMRGTRTYCHPGWLFDSAVSVADGKRVKYSTNNDIYAFIYTAHAALEEACMRNETPEYQKRLRIARDQLESWRQQPFDKLPTLDRVLAVLQQLEREPELVLAEQLKKCRL